MNARQNIRLPHISNMTVQEAARLDKESLYINENFKSMFDAIDDMSKKIKKLEKQLEELGGSE